MSFDPDELNALLPPTHPRGPRSMAYLDMLFGAMRPPEPLDAPALGIVVDAIETRPQDWAAPARRILEERRAFRQYRR